MELCRYCPERCSYRRAPSRSEMPASAWVFDRRSWIFIPFLFPSSWFVSADQYTAYACASQRYICEFFVGNRPKISQTLFLGQSIISGMEIKGFSQPLQRKIHPAARWALAASTSAVLMLVPWRPFQTDAPRTARPPCAERSSSRRCSPPGRSRPPWYARRRPAVWPG